ncbi:gastric triacylglycerol lipase-like isoform X2 [Leptinotarsa decemlineata]|uniref:gastric triacylglycerol lipase isoform X2 n=1 Tax=Leptinotarsa decemlineata TaxID=7539 RepID=UPI003D3045C5
MIVPLVSFVSLISLGETVLVCDNYDSYYHPDNKHCFENKDAERNITEIISNWGYTAEEYNIYTKDGYQISVIRAYKNITRRTPIVMGHGILVNALSWVYRKNKSLAFHLGERGYDVWMINFRGTIYSTDHKFFRNNERKYWSFSFHEMGVYDIASTLDLVVAKTKKKSIYLGFSQGSTASYVYGTKLPDVAQKNLKAIISIGPVAYLNHIRFYVKILAKFTDLLKLYYRLILLLLGDSTGVDVLVHYAQILESGEFREQSFGVTSNLERYGQETPPHYNLSRIPVPVFLIAGKKDDIASAEDAKLIYSQLNDRSKSGIHILEYEKFAHNDFIESTNVRDLLYGTLQEAVDKFEYS